MNVTFFYAILVTVVYIFMIKSPKSTNLPPLLTLLLYAAKKKKKKRNYHSRKNTLGYIFV